MEVGKTISDMPDKEEWEAVVTVVEQDRETAIRWKKQGGADAVRVDETWLEFDDDFIEERGEGAAVLPILPQSFETGRPMPRSECPTQKSRVARLFSEAVGGHQQWRTAVGRQSGNERPEAFLRTASEGGAVEKEDVELVVHVWHVEDDG